MGNEISFYRQIKRYHLAPKYEFRSQKVPFGDEISFPRQKVYIVFNLEYLSEMLIMIEFLISR